MKTANTAVVTITVANDLERRVALATVKVGDVRISGVAVWRVGKGGLRVYWPRYWQGAGQAEAIDLPPELRSDIEADVISAYKQARAEAEKAAVGADVIAAYEAGQAEARIVESKRREDS